MKLYIMKKEAMETLKANLPLIYGKYYTEPTNNWIEDICGENPFIEFKDVPDFSLTDLESDLKPGEIDFNNCKIIYEKLQFLSESQASDERLWAGLTHSTFYGYMRKRWKYGYGKKPKSTEKETGEIKTRFFYNAAGRSGFYRNTISKCWWVGHNTFDSSNVKNHFENLDIIGSSDLSSKINEFFYSFTFSSNPHIMSAIIESLRSFRNSGQHLLVRDHIRPAMSYLNAVGGSMVLDCLEKDTISDIFTDAIEAIMQGDSPSLNLDNITSSDYEDISEYDENEVSDISEDVEVTLGCKITICNSKKEIKKYKYDFMNNSWLDILDSFTGRKIGDTVELFGDTWEIIDIVL